MFERLPSSVELEEQVLAFWDREDIFPPTSRSYSHLEMINGSVDKPLAKPHWTAASASTLVPLNPSTLAKNGRKIVPPAVVSVLTSTSTILAARSRSTLSTPAARSLALASA